VNISLSPQETKRRVQDLTDLLEVMAVEVAKDGGTIALQAADCATGVINITLGGACGTCSLTGTTLQDGVVRILTQRLDWITEVRGTVDETSSTEGQNGWRPRL
jgi:Fe-S cluster biogenesis protein NfuA